MQTVTVITQEQYEQVVNQPFAKGCYFNPVKDADENWIVSFEELLAIEDKQFLWLWDLPQTIYKPAYQPNDFIF